MKHCSSSASPLCNVKKCSRKIPVLHGKSFKEWSLSCRRFSGVWPTLVPTAHFALTRPPAKRSKKGCGDASTSTSTSITSLEFTLKRCSPNLSIRAAIILRTLPTFNLLVRTRSASHARRSLSAPRARVDARGGESQLTTARAKQYPNMAKLTLRPRLQGSGQIFARKNLARFHLAFTRDRRNWTSFWTTKSAGFPSLSSS